MSGKVYFRCPYCQVNNRFDLALLDEDYQVVWCEPEDGGCGQPVVVKPTVSVTMEVRAIEGIGVRRRVTNDKLREAASHNSGVTTAEAGEALRNVLGGD